MSSIRKFKKIFRCEKERNSISQELDENQALLQQDQAEKANVEKNGKMINNQISDMSMRMEDIQRALHEADGSKRKLMVENCDLQHHQVCLHKFDKISFFSIVILCVGRS